MKYIILLCFLLKNGINAFLCTPPSYTEITSNIQTIDDSIFNLLQTRLKLSEECERYHRGKLEDIQHENKIIQKNIYRKGLRPEYIKKMYETIFWETKYALYSRNEI